MKEGRKTNNNRAVLVYLHGPAQSSVIGGSAVISRRREGGVPDLVLALVEQKVGSVGLKAETHKQFPLQLSFKVSHLKKKEKRTSD